MATFNKSLQAQQGSAITSPKISAADFFGSEDSPNYSTREGFMTYGQTLSPSDEENLRRGIQFFNEGLKTDGGSEIKRDIAGKQYQYYRFYKSRSRPGVKFILAPFILRLISDYENGVISIGFTLDDLINEARKS